MFILLGRDRHAAVLVKLWALMRHRENEAATKLAAGCGDQDGIARASREERVIAEALQCADAMDDYILAKKGLTPEQTHRDFGELFEAVTDGMEEHPEGYDCACLCRACFAYDD